MERKLMREFPARVLNRPRHMMMLPLTPNPVIVRQDTFNADLEEICLKFTGHRYSQMTFYAHNDYVRNAEIWTPAPNQPYAFMSLAPIHEDPLDYKVDSHMTYREVEDRLVEKGISTRMDPEVLDEFAAFVIPQEAYPSISPNWKRILIRTRGGKPKQSYVAVVRQCLAASCADGSEKYEVIDDEETNTTEIRDVPPKRGPRPRRFYMLETREDGTKEWVLRDGLLPNSTIKGLWPDLPEPRKGNDEEPGKQAAAAAAKKPAKVTAAGPSAAATHFSESAMVKSSSTTGTTTGTGSRTATGSTTTTGSRTKETKVANGITTTTRVFKMKTATAELKTMEKEMVTEKPTTVPRQTTVVSESTSAAAKPTTATELYKAAAARVPTAGNQFAVSMRRKTDSDPFGTAGAAAAMTKAVPRPTVTFVEPPAAAAIEPFEAAPAWSMASTRNPFAASVRRKTDSDPYGPAAGSNIGFSTTSSQMQARNQTCLGNIAMDEEEEYASSLQKFGVSRRFGVEHDSSKAKLFDGEVKPKKKVRLVKRRFFDEDSSNESSEAEDNEGVRARKRFDQLEKDSLTAEQMEEEAVEAQDIPSTQDDDEDPFTSYDPFKNTAYDPFAKKTETKKEDLPSGCAAAKRSSEEGDYVEKPESVTIYEGDEIPDLWKGIIGRTNIPRHLLPQEGPVNCLFEGDKEVDEKFRVFNEFCRAVNAPPSVPAQGYPYDEFNDFEDEDVDADIYARAQEFESDADEPSVDESDHEEDYAEEYEPRFKAPHEKIVLDRSTGRLKIVKTTDLDTYEDPSDVLGSDSEDSDSDSDLHTLPHVGMDETCHWGRARDPFTGEMGDFLIPNDKTQARFFEIRRPGKRMPKSYAEYRAEAQPRFKHRL